MNEYIIPSQKKPGPVSPNPVAIRSQKWGKDRGLTAFFLFEIENGCYDESCPTAIVYQVSLTSEWIVVGPNYGSVGPGNWIAGKFLTLVEALPVGEYLAVNPLLDGVGVDMWGDITSECGDILYID